MLCGRCKSTIQLENVRFCPFCGNPVQRRPEERRNAIVVFADISGFTDLSQKTDPGTLRQLVDKLMKRFIGTVEEHGGGVDKIIGDCIMFVFGAERSSPDDPLKTIETVEALRNDVDRFREEGNLASNSTSASRTAPYPSAS